MVARQNSGRLDLFSYALVFLIVVIAAEVIIAACIW